MNFIFKALAFSLAAIVFSPFAYATKLERGRAGLEEVAFSVANTGSLPLSCGATLAHWYSQPIGTAAPGATISGSLWLKRETGAIFLLNQLEDRMPVERLWCGQEGASWKTRREISLERRKGEVPGVIRLNCASSNQTTQCSKQ